jgi:hypothetical protein
MATDCLIAFFFDDGWLVPIDPSFFQSSTNVLILLLTIDRADVGSERFRTQPTGGWPQ